MAKYRIRTYNSIAKIGLDRFSADYEISDKSSEPDAILLRSFNLHDELIAESVLAVGRAGAGVNNVPVESLNQRGIAIFNAPGANANSVKELVLASMLMAVRNVPAAISYTQTLKMQDIEIQVEAGKKKFVGSELSGKTLGVIGLGSIGYRVANAAVDLGMKVIGYDATMTIQNAWQLSPAVKRIENIDELFRSSNIITLHIPLLDSTKGLIDRKKIAIMKPEAVLLNFSRDEIVDEDAVLAALDDRKLGYYVTDFPNALTHNHANVIALPHLGASTSEAEDNCAVMVADQLQDYLENGNVRFSVNLPEVVLPKNGGARLALIHRNEPGVMAQISDILRDEQINIADLLNKSRGNIAYTIVDIEAQNVSEKLKSKLQSIPELLRLRIL